MNLHLSLQFSHGLHFSSRLRSSAAASPCEVHIMRHFNEVTPPWKFKIFNFLFIQRLPKQHTVILAVNSSGAVRHWFKQFFRQLGLLYVQRFANSNCHRKIEKLSRCHCSNGNDVNKELHLFDGVLKFRHTVKRRVSSKSSTISSSYRRCCFLTQKDSKLNWSFFRTLPLRPTRAATVCCTKMLNERRRTRDSEWDASNEQFRTRGSERDSPNEKLRMKAVEREVLNERFWTPVPLGVGAAHTLGTKFRLNAEFVSRHQHAVWGYSTEDTPIEETSLQILEALQAPNWELNRCFSQSSEQLFSWQFRAGESENRRA